MKRKLFEEIFSQEFDLEESKWRGPFDFVDRNSSKLFITIGDSWTYGRRLEDEVNEFKEDYRINHCYGGLISSELNWDFLNISIPGSNNLWMAMKYRQILDNFDRLGYDQIKIMITFTEYGREFWTEFDNRIPEIFDQYRKCYTPVDVAKTISNKVAEMLSAKNSNIELITGINYVSNLYPESLQVLPKSWLEILLGHDISDDCIVVGSWVIPKYLNLTDANPKVDKAQALNEAEDMIDLANKRLNLIYSSGYNHKDGYGHPNSRGHEMWAKYIMDSVNF